MKRLIICACLALAGCTIPGVGSIGSPPAAPPAPLAQTTIDDRAIIVAEQAYDHVLDIVDARVASGKLHGPAALRVKDALKKVSDALAAASAAQRAGQATTWASALAEADKAFTALLAVLG